MSTFVKRDLNLDDILSRQQLRYYLGATYNDILPNPDRVIRKKGVLSEWQFYEDILLDDMVNTCWNKIARSVAGLKWEIYQGEADQAVYDTVNFTFNDLATKGMIKNTIINIVKKICYGRNFIGVDYLSSNGMLLPSRLFTLPLELFFFDLDDNILRYDFVAKDFMTIVPPMRVLAPRNNPTLRNPYGESCLSKSYWLTFFKKNALSFMNIFLEKYGMPWVLTLYDKMILDNMFKDITDPESQIKALSNHIESMVQNCNLVLPKELDIKFENSGHDGAFNVKNFEILIDLCNASITRIWTGHNATTTSTAGKLGSEDNALSDFDNVIQEQKEAVVEQMNILIRWICDINFDTQVYPIFQFYEEHDINLELANRDAILAEKLGLRFRDTYIQKNYIESLDDFYIVDPQANKQPPVNPVQNPVTSIVLQPIIAKIEKGLITDYEQLRSEIRSLTGNVSNNTIEALVAQCYDHIRINMQ